MSGKKLRAPQIENDTTAFTQSSCKPSKHVPICCRIEIAEALRHDDRDIERAGFRSVVANVPVHVAWAASLRASFRDGHYDRGRCRSPSSRGQKEPDRVVPCRNTHLQVCRNAARERNGRRTLSLASCEPRQYRCGRTQTTDESRHSALLA